MSDQSSMRAEGNGGYRFVYDPATQPELFDGVLSKRIVAFFVDAIIVVLLMIPASLVVLLLGIVTLGLGWFLFAPLFAIVALGYSALTLGGPASATIGMRLSGIELRTWNGSGAFAAARRHALAPLLALGERADAADPTRRTVHLSQAASPRPPSRHGRGQFRSACAKPLIGLFDASLFVLDFSSGGTAVPRK